MQIHDPFRIIEIKILRMTTFTLSLRYQRWIVTYGLFYIERRPFSKIFRKFPIKDKFYRNLSLKIFFSILAKIISHLKSTKNLDR